MVAMKSTYDIGHGRMRALWHGARLLRGLYPSAVVCALLAVAGLVASFAIPDDTAIAMRVQANTQLMSSFVQWRRAGTVKADIAFVGDSTCENGIESEYLSRQLGARVINLCTMAYAGPGGYGETLEAFLAQADARARVVIALHPHFFDRDKAWEDAWGSPAAIARTLQAQYDSPLNPANLWRREKAIYVNTLFESLIDTPTEHPSVSATIGGLRTYRRMMEDRGFYYLTTLTSCWYCTPDQYARHVGEAVGPGKSAKSPPTPNANFAESAARLRRTLERIGADRVYLLFMPFGDEELSEAGADEFQHIARQTAAMMGVPPRHILEGPVRVPSRMLGDGLHFYRPAQFWYSWKLVPLLRRILPDARAG